MFGFFEPDAFGELFVRADDVVPPVFVVVLGGAVFFATFFVVAAREAVVFVAGAEPFLGALPFGPVSFVRDGPFPTKDS